MSGDLAPSGDETGRRCRQGRRPLVDFAAHPRRQPVQLLVKQRRAFADKVLAQSTEESRNTL